MEITWPTINNPLEFIAVLVIVIAFSILKRYEIKFIKDREKKRDYEISLITAQNENIISMLMLVIKNFNGIVDENLMRLIYSVYLDRATIRVTDLIDQIVTQHHIDHSIDHENIISWLKRDVNILYENDMSELKGFTYLNKTLDFFIKKEIVDVIIHEAFQCIMNEKSAKSSRSIIQQTFNEQKNIILKNALAHKI